ncbi:TrmH family RNA methyltransferase [Aurantibacter sp.]|uniref:TrmH family RNA methyltransferase n=1 Tax=Aurantibacter sp. TaxID=2807103 RepID=UPI0035C83E4F
MLTKNDIKLIARLKQKKYRIQEGLFVVEGIKTIKEFIESSFKLHQIYTTETFGLSTSLETIISETELNKISFFTNPNTALALFKLPDVIENKEASGLIVVLDTINDPGNLGTIIRLCDWFGVSKLVCSKDTVDCYNPKVVQSTMGSLTRVKIAYVDLECYLETTKLPIYGTFMNGENVYKTNKLPQNSILVMGNEANGISSNIEALVSKRLAIPRFGNIQETESLNVATATAIILSEFKRYV